MKFAKAAFVVLLWVAAGVCIVLQCNGCGDDVPPDACPGGELALILDCGPAANFDADGLENVECIGAGSRVLGDCLLYVASQRAPLYHCRPADFCAVAP